MARQEVSMGLMSSIRGLVRVPQPAPIVVGQKCPSVQVEMVQESYDDEDADPAEFIKDTGDLFASEKAILLGMPGAWLPAQKHRASPACNVLTLEVFSRVVHCTCAHLTREIPNDRRFRFTPTCTDVHVPGFVKEAERFARLGYDIYCASAPRRT